MKTTMRSTQKRSGSRAEIAPIRTEADHRRAVADIERLWNAEPGTPDGDRLDVLVVLADAYEQEHHAIDMPTPVDAIKFRMEQQGLNRKDLEPLIGSRARVSEVLSGKRALSIDMIRRLHRELGIPAAVLIGETRSKRARAA